MIESLRRMRPTSECSGCEKFEPNAFQGVEATVPGALPVAGWLLIPVQRPADAAALLELACRDCEQENGGRHRAPDREKQSEFVNCDWGTRIRDSDCVFDYLMASRPHEGEHVAAGSK